MQHLEVSGAVRHIYIYIYVIRRLEVKLPGTPWANLACRGIPLLYFGLQNLVKKRCAVVAEGNPLLICSWSSYSTELVLYQCYFN